MRQGKRSGFEVLDVRSRVPVHPRTRQIANVAVIPRPLVTGRRGRSWRPLTFYAVTYEGLLRVTDSDVFRKSLKQGIGPGKAYGFGLLSIAPARIVP